MTDKVTARKQRFHKGDRADQRNEFQRDRDRLLYCSAFRRLAEVTQVVSAAEGHSFHNRLTHTLKVAQISRRLAEKLLNEQKDVAAELGGPDPEVAEAAALAHDLGHPPFGHTAEELLQTLGQEVKEEDGFEGNAQSFRIVTTLAIRTGSYVGLNLTAATLNGILKYPWYRATKGEYRSKWGVYPSEREQFEWARDAVGAVADTRSVEAELMDWADDIAYSVFDIDDFYRAGLIPLNQVFSTDEGEKERFIAGATQRLKGKKKDPAPIIDAFRQIASIFPSRSLGGAFQGRSEQRAFLRQWTSELVARYINGIHLRMPEVETVEGGIELRRPVTISKELKYEVESLKQLVWHYVIDNERLGTQQHGERAVIRSLFTLLREGALAKKFEIFPELFRKALGHAESTHDFERAVTRIVIDMISSMTETQALRLHKRLIGASIGSIHDQV